MVNTECQSDERFAPGLSDAELVEAVLAHYRAALVDAPAVTGWLVEHGVRSGEIVEHFGLGFADRTLGLSFPSGAAGRPLRDRLQALGLSGDRTGQPARQRQRPRQRRSVPSRRGRSTCSRPGPASSS